MNKLIKIMNEPTVTTYLENEFLDKTLDEYISKNIQLDSSYKFLDGEIFIEGAEEDIFDVKEGRQSIKVLVRYINPLNENIKNLYMEVTNAFVQLLKTEKSISIYVRFPDPNMVNVKELAAFNI